MLKRGLFLFTSGTIGGGIGAMISSGVKGDGKPYDFAKIALSGMPVGAQLASFPLSCWALAKISPKFKSLMMNKDRQPFKFYFIGGVGAAAIYTAITYTAQTVLYNRETKGEKKSFKFSNYYDAFLDRLGFSIGFPLGMDYIQGRLPIPPSPIARYARDYSCLMYAQIVGKTMAYPVLRYRHGIRYTRMMKQFINNFPNIMITSDCVSVVKPIFNFMLE